MNKGKVSYRHKDVSGKNNPMWGRIQSKETRLKIAASRHGRVWINLALFGESKCVPKEDLRQWEMIGWKRGRKA